MRVVRFCYLLFTYLLFIEVFLKIEAYEKFLKPFLGYMYFCTLKF